MKKEGTEGKREGKERKCKAGRGKERQGKTEKTRKGKVGLGKATCVCVCRQGKTKNDTTRKTAGKGS